MMPDHSEVSRLRKPIDSIPLHTFTLALLLSQAMDLFMESPNLHWHAYEDSPLCTQRVLGAPNVLPLTLRCPQRRFGQSSSSRLHAALHDHLFDDPTTHSRRLGDEVAVQSAEVRRIKHSGIRSGGLTSCSWSPLDPANRGSVMLSMVTSSPLGYTATSSGLPSNLKI